jgi:hypothetical protein
VLTARLASKCSRLHVTAHSKQQPSDQQAIPTVRRTPPHSPLEQSTSVYESSLSYMLYTIIQAKLYTRVDSRTHICLLRYDDLQNQCSSLLDTRQRVWIDC